MMLCNHEEIAVQIAHGYAKATGKPMAVIEAKKTAKDARVGAEQARIYAACLERETGVRPVIFFTNGLDI